MPSEFSRLSTNRHLASSEFGASWDVAKAFDGNNSTYWVSTATSGVGWLRVETAAWLQQWIPSSYAIRVNTIPEPARAPKDFTFEGSNDLVAWTVLNTQTAQTGWTSGQTRTYTLSGVTTPYRYFRLNITANNGDSYLQTAEFYIYGDQTAGTDTLISPPANMTAATAPSPYVATESSYWTSVYDYRFWRAMAAAVMPANQRGWTATSGGAAWARIDLGAAAAFPCTRYEIYVSSVGAQAPKDWTLRGSPNGSAWTTIDTVTGQTGWVGPRRFTPDIVTTAYRHYEINITANNGDGTYTGIAEFYMWGSAPPVGRSQIFID